MFILTEKVVWSKSKNKGMWSEIEKPTSSPSVISLNDNCSTVVRRALGGSFDFMLNHGHQCDGGVKSILAPPLRGCGRQGGNESNPESPCNDIATPRWKVLDKSATLTSGHQTNYVERPRRESPSAKCRSHPDGWTTSNHQENAR